MCPDSVVPDPLFCERRIGSAVLFAPESLPTDSSAAPRFQKVPLKFMELLYLRSSFYAVDGFDERKRHKNQLNDGKTGVVSLSELQEQLLCHI